MQVAIGLALCLSAGCRLPSGPGAGVSLAPVPAALQVITPAAPVALQSAARNRFCVVYSHGVRGLAGDVAAAVAGIGRQFDGAGWPLPAAPLEVHLYRDWSAFAAATGCPAVGPQHDGVANVVRGAMYLVQSWQSRGRVLEAARHESVHLFLHEAGGFPVPAAARAAGLPERLPAVPWWLNEGMATCFEFELSNRGVGAGISPGRCMELRALLASGKCPEVRAVLALRPDHVGSSAEYAVAWGIVYGLLFPPPPVAHGEALQRLRTYLTTCRRGFMADPERDFRMLFLDAAGHPVPKLEEAWAAHIVTGSSFAFTQQLLPVGMSLSQWEAAWRQQMLRLNPVIALPRK